MKTPTARKLPASTSADITITQKSYARCEPQPSRCGLNGDTSEICHSRRSNRWIAVHWAVVKRGSPVYLDRKGASIYARVAFHPGLIRAVRRTPGRCRRGRGNSGPSRSARRRSHRGRRRVRRGAATHDSQLVARRAAERNVVQAHAEFAERSRRVHAGCVGEYRTACRWPTPRPTWWNPASVSSSSAGSVPKSARYQGVLTDRSRTVTATWVRAGKSCMRTPYLVVALRERHYPAREVLRRCGGRIWPGSACPTGTAGNWPATPCAELSGRPGAAPSRVVRTGAAQPLPTAARIIVRKLSGQKAGRGEQVERAGQPCAPATAETSAPPRL